MRKYSQLPNNITLLHVLMKLRLILSIKACILFACLHWTSFIYSRTLKKHVRILDEVYHESYLGFLVAIVASKFLEKNLKDEVKPHLPCFSTLLSPLSVNPWRALIYFYFSILVFPHTYESRKGTYFFKFLRILSIIVYWFTQEKL